jgi:hypothetical protein
VENLDELFFIISSKFTNVESRAFLRAAGLTDGRDPPIGLALAQNIKAL